MKRIQKERDRLLRKIARIYGLTGAVGALLCIIVPGTTTGVQFAAAALLSVAAGALVFLHTERGGVPTAVGVIGVAAALILRERREQAAPCASSATSTAS